VARAATGRNKIVKFDGCYHGHVDSMLVRAGSGLAEMASPDSAGVSEAVASDTIVVPLDDIDQFEKVFQIHGSSIAAVIVEPIPANNGLLLQSSDFLARISEIAHSAGSLVIFDEVITGFRVAFGGMAEVSGLRPDLVTYGKIIGGGFPVGAYGGRADLMDWVAPAGPVYQAGTLSANPVAMTAGIAMLLKLKRDNPYSDLEKKTESLAQEIEALTQKYQVPGRIQRSASLFWSVFGTPDSPQGIVRRPEQTPAEHKSIYTQVFHSLLDQGIYLAPSAFEVSFLSTAHEPKHLDRLLTALEKSLKELKK
jgi:glutamate-1-semialdehyde 2,1-aminomutase